MTTLAAPDRNRFGTPSRMNGARIIGEASATPVRASGLVRILPLIAVLMPLAMVAGAAWLLWQDVRNDAEVAMRRSAAASAEYTARALESYTIALGQMNERLRGFSDDDIRADERRLHLDLQRVMRELPQGATASVLDRSGRVLVSSEQFPADRGVRHEGRDYFIALRRAVPPTVHIGEAAIADENGDLVVTMARRRQATGNLPAAEDGFEGVAVIAVRSDELVEGLHRQLVVPSDAIALVHANGSVLAMTSGEPLAAAPAEGPFRAALAGRGLTLFETLPATWMPGAALATVHPVEDLVVYALALRPRAQLVEIWRSRMTWPVAFAVPAAMTLLLMSLKIGRDAHLLAQMNQALRGDVAQGMDRLRRAEEIAMIGTFEFDTRTGINIRSAEYMNVHGLPAFAAREAHADWVRRLHPDDRDRAEANILGALEDPNQTDYAQTYRIVTPKGEVRWIMSRGRIERDDAGQATILRGAHLDVTQLRMTELALADTDARLRLAQETVGIGTWEWVPSTRTLTCSRKMLELWGLDPTTETPSLQALLACVHKTDREGLASLMAEQRPGVDLRGEYRLHQQPGNTGAPETWLGMRAAFQPGDAFAPARMIGVAYDITNRKQSDAMQTMMAHEVEHRAKNALMIVSSLLRMTKADSAESLVELMDVRIRSLSRTLGLLGKGRWLGASLREIVQNETAHFERAETGTPPVITLDGPAVTIDADTAQPLSMAVHELATNAAKYGALSAAGGTLRIDWWMEGATLRLRWVERGGPVLAGAPSRLGFGSRLIKSLIESQMQGSVEKRWCTAGLVCDIAVPLGQREQDQS